MRTIRLFVVLWLAFIACLQLSAQEDSCDIPLVVTRFVPATKKVELVTDLTSHDLDVTVAGTPSIVRSAPVDGGAKRVALILDASRRIPDDEWDLETEMASDLASNGRALDRFSLGIIGADATFSPLLPAADVQSKLKELAASRPQSNGGSEKLYDALFAASKVLDPPEFGDAIFFFGHPDDLGSQTTLAKIQGVLLRNRLRFYAITFGGFPPLPDPNNPLPNGANPAGVDNTAHATGYFFDYRNVASMKFPGQTALMKEHLAELYAGITSPYRVKIVQTAPGRSSLELKVVNAAGRNIRPDDVHYPHFVYPCTTAAATDNATEEAELPTRPTARRTRISPAVLDRLVTHKFLPQPPWSNEKGHEQGDVTIAVVLDYDGSLKSTSVVSGDPVLAEVATDALKKWQFKPFLLGGQPFQAESRVMMKFGKKSVEVILDQH